MRVVGTCDYLLGMADPDLTLAARTLRELIARDEQDSNAPGVERPAFDLAEQVDAWCIECGRQSGHATHRPATGEHGEIICEQCGVTLADD